MKKKTIIILIMIILAITVIAIIGINKFMQYKIKNEEKILIDIAEDIVSSEENKEINIFTKEELELKDNVIGILEIPKINLKAPVKEGTTQDILKYAVGHFTNSSNWNGNIALASHNRGNYVAHYFENIKDLQMGDEIIYKTKFGERRYSVTENKQIESTDWSVISKTKENKITLITCVKNKPELRICVQAIEK